MTQSNAPRPAARLVLEDGTVFHGRGFGAASHSNSSTGEVVFNTAMTGYQEALTDPSYAGQILTMTATQVGNYGVNLEDVESAKPQIAGFVIRELSRVRSNHRSTADLSNWLAEHGILGIEGLDTRALVRRLRLQGAMRGVISTDQSKIDSDLVKLAQNAPQMSGCNLAAAVSPVETSNWREDLGEWSRHAATAKKSSKRFRVVALDCGAKRNIYRNLVDRGCDVQVMPHDVTAGEIRKLKPDGLFVSNGPGDPEVVDATVQTLREVAGELPTFGICLGHQLLALAMGATTYKLKFGHRGANQPVRNLLTEQVEITSQNHGFCVDPDSLHGLDCEVTHRHMNDNTIAGFRHISKPVFGVQYHPEASPGPHDSAYLFDCFVRMMGTRQPISADDMRQAQSMTTPVLASVPE